MSETSRISEQEMVLAMDYGQFTLSGGLADIDDELELLDRALESQPCAGDGKVVVVLSPHQNNFEMPITVQVWDGCPPADRADWQQVCEERLLISEDGQLMISSPTTGEEFCAVPAGDYLVEVSGRGFVNHGWPGSTTPGDVWRIRLWPNDGTAPMAPQLWEMPEEGTAESPSAC